MRSADSHAGRPPDHHGAPRSATAAPTCRETIGLLLDYLDETLDPDTLTGLARHFRSCAPCLAYLRTYDRSRQLVVDVIRDEPLAELPALKGRLRALLLGRPRA